MKRIVVQDQVRLGPGRCLQLALSGMRYRMFRSMVTVSILALAVAFLVHVVGHALLAQRVVRGARRELQGHHSVALWVGRLTAPDDQRTVIHELAFGREDRRREYARWGGLSDGELHQAIDAARQLEHFAAYLGDLPESSRVVLSGGHDAMGLLQELSAPQAYDRFVAHLAELKRDTASILGSDAALTALIHGGVPKLESAVARIAKGQGQAIAQVRHGLGDHSPLALLGAPPPDLEAVLARAGFAVAPGSLGALAGAAQANLDRERLANLLEPSDMRELLAREMRLRLALVNEPVILNWLSTSARADWLANQLHTRSGEIQLTAARILAVAQTYQRQMRLEEVLNNPAPGSNPTGDADEAEVPGAGAHPAWFLSDLPASMLWLIVLSFLVCLVGVANAMLMSVTERFAEIATMKCLGALDGFILVTFLFEAMLQGLFGGAAGIVLGLLLAVVRALSDFGGLTWEGLHAYPQLLASAGVALVTGVVLAGLAAVWPAWVAARLAPMEAMRVD